MQCRKCGFDNSEGSSFCGGCGSELKQIAEMPLNIPERQNGAGYLRGSFSRRTTAHIIDYLLLNTFLLILFEILGINDEYRRMSSGLDAYQGLTGSAAYTIVSVLFTWLYFSLMETLNSATLGKLILGLRVVDTDGCMLGFGKASVRYLGKWLSALILGIGYLVMLFDKNRLTMHDKLTETQVIEVDH